MTAYLNPDQLYQSFPHSLQNHHHTHHHSPRSSSDMSQSEPFPSLPRINTDLAKSPPPPQSRPREYTDSSLTSPTTGRRVLSDKVKSTPSSLVRRLRIYSNSNMDALSPSPSIASSPPSPTVNSLLNQDRFISETLPPELSPVVNLINAQKLRTYAIGRLRIPGLDEAGQKVWIEVEAKLTGNELAIWRPSVDQYAVDGNDEFKPKYINLIDCKIELPGDLQIKFLQDFTDNNSLMARFESPQDYHHWLAAIQLSKFEYTSLNEAFTAVILSLKGTTLSDIHILLSPKKRFPRYEWCNLRLPQVSSKWLKVYVAIIPSESKKTGRVEMYTSDKISKKNLILYVPFVSSVYNVYPEHHDMIDFNSIMKMNGDIYINRQYEHLFVHSDSGNSTPIGRSLSFKTHSRAGSSSSLSSMNSRNITPGKHSRNVSVNSTSSFFSSAPSPNPDAHNTASATSSTTELNVTNTSPKKHKSILSSNSTFFKSKSLLNYATTNYLYLMPVPHPGVTAIEIMLRNFIHIIDSFKLYGRPQHLISDKANSLSLLFGLPSLPHFEYLSMEDATNIIAKHLKEATNDSWNDFHWRNVFKNFLSTKYDKMSASGHKYKGHGNIIKLYNSLEADSAEINDYETISSPKIPLPIGADGSNDDVLSGNDVYEFESFSSAVSPIASEPSVALNGQFLSDPIEFKGIRSPPNRSPQPSISRSPQPVMRSGFASRSPQPMPFPDRSLEPIADMPTPADESHPYQNLVGLSLNDDRK